MISSESTKKQSFVQSILSFLMRTGSTISLVGKYIYLTALIAAFFPLYLATFTLKALLAFTLSLTYFAMNDSTLRTFPSIAGMIPLKRAPTYLEYLFLFSYSLSPHGLFKVFNYGSRRGLL